MKDDKRGGRKPAPVPTGHDQRAAARDRVPRTVTGKRCHPAEQGACARRHLRLLGIKIPASMGSFAFSCAWRKPKGRR
ncbi:MAG: hypothetical protein ACLRRN_05220 [Oscillospiraceae bacterium]